MEQLIRALMALRTDSPIDVTDLPEDIRAVRTTVAAASALLSVSSATLHTVQLEAIQHALSIHNGNVSAAARALGISRGTLYKKLKASTPLANAARHARSTPVQFLHTCVSRLFGVCTPDGRGHRNKGR